mmetsp:Transcript_22773/g.41083  ORF Transcript_22773/g.41083 Transcript_22773/m.41083 type:complete len:376 (+) Transcript_22773:36-1163(+)
MRYNSVSAGGGNDHRSSKGGSATANDQYERMIKEKTKQYSCSTAKGAAAYRGRVTAPGATARDRFESRLHAKLMENSLSGEKENDDRSKDHYEKTIKDKKEQHSSSTANEVIARMRGRVSAPGATARDRLETRLRAKAKEYRASSENTSADHRGQINGPGSTSEGKVDSRLREGDAIASDNLTLDQKIKLKKSRRQKLKHPRSSMAKRRDRELGAAETHEKRMLQRSVLKDLGRQKSTRVIAKANEGKNARHGIDNSAKQNLQQYSGLVRSCSASNLCPGSWQCTNCTYINEPVGLNPCTACKVCNAPNNEIVELSNKLTMSKQHSLRLSDAVPDSEPPSKSKSQDDINVRRVSWSELDVVVAVTAMLSMLDKLT